MADEEKNENTEAAAAENDAAAEVEEEKESQPLSPLMQSVIDALGAALPDLKPTARADGWVEVFVEPDRWLEVARTLRDDPRLNFDYLSLLSAVDYMEKGFQVVYHLLSLLANKKLVVKVDVPDREQPTVPSITSIWPTADFHEREAWDLMGIKFEGHPNLRRILLREDWVGHPLRKDYVDERAPRERVTRETYFEHTYEKRQLNA